MTPRRTCERLLLSLVVLIHSTAAYNIGVGRADITGPSVEVNLMGYAKLDQVGTGIHLRQFARAFIINDKDQSMVLVCKEGQSVSHFVRLEVMKRLRKKYGTLYTEDNVMMSGTHTHSTPAGFLAYLLFDFTALGFVEETFNAYCDGIYESVVRAHENLAEGKISIAKGDLMDVNINRSPTAYEKNPEEERKRYAYNVDKTMVQLRFERLDGTIIGAFSWYAVHAVSMNNTNTLVSTDNLGYAALRLEQTMNTGELPGRGSFVGAFVQSNEGDSSPNIMEPRCIKTGLACDPVTSSCEDEDSCIAFGPGKDMWESTKIIGERLFDKALMLMDSSTEREYISGPVRVLHQYQDMSTYKTKYWNSTLNKEVEVRGCLPAMGYSFAAGTIDGPALKYFTQSTTTGNALWDGIRDVIKTPTEDMKKCHAPKPILLATGLMNFPYEWQPAVVSTQLALVGDLAIACVPGELTTMAGRRLRSVLQESANLSSTGRVLIAGLCNTYSDYITTPEEYQVQRYEGASTIYGPHTLTIYLDVFKKLAEAAVSSMNVTENPPPANFADKLVSLLPGVVLDSPGVGKHFGQVLTQPPASAKPGETVLVRFVGANPRNDLQHEATYLTVEKEDNSLWTIVATDASWETTFHWERKNEITGSSEVVVQWTIPNQIELGTYRIQYFGHSKKLDGTISAFNGTTNSFQVIQG